MMATPLVYLLDCHYQGDNRGPRATWDHARLEERLGRDFNRLASSWLTAREVPHRRINSDSALPETCMESHLSKLAQVVGHDPVPSICVEVHFNRCPRARNGIHVQARKESPEARQLAALIARGMARENGLADAYDVIEHPDPRYVESRLFSLLAAHQVPLVLVEAGNLENDRIREDLWEHGRTFRGFVLGVVNAIQTWSEGLACGLLED